MTTMTIQLPESLHKTILDTIQQDGISINQFVINALAEKISSLLKDNYLQERAARASRASYEAALAEVPDVEPEEEDQLPALSAMAA